LKTTDLKHKEKRERERERERGRRGRERGNSETLQFKKRQKFLYFEGSQAVPVCTLVEICVS
jgi:hypothetical protein